MRHFDAGLMADQHPVRVQRALGLARGARGVDHQGRIIGDSDLRGECGRSARERLVEGERLVTRAVDRQHKVRQRVAAIGELGEALGIGNQRPGAGIP